MALPTLDVLIMYLLLIHRNQRTNGAVEFEGWVFSVRVASFFVVLVLRCSRRITLCFAVVVVLLCWTVRRRRRLPRFLFVVCPASGL